MYMPSKYRQKYAKKSRKMTYRQYKNKKVAKSLKFGIGGGTKNFNLLNKVVPQKYVFKESFQFNNIVGAGSAIVGVNGMDMSQVPRYNALITMFRKYRIIALKWRFRLRTIELTDQAEHPTMYIRYNYDPDLTTTSIGENFMLRQSNMICKQFIHNTPEGCNLEYTIRPAVMGDRKNIAGVYKPSPLFKQWLDFTGIVNGEIMHYGLQYFVTNLPTGQTLDQDLQVEYECTDLI